MIDKFLIKLRRYDHVTVEEERALRAAMSDVVDFQPDRTMVRAKAELNSSNLLLDGFVHRYKDLHRGARQTLQLGVPGDFLDLHSLLMKQIDHDIGSLTRCRIALFPHERLSALLEEHAHLGRLLWLSTIVDAAIHREWIVSLGVRSALSRLAHLLCELQVRLEVVGIAQGCSYDMPLTQQDLSQILGMTPVHINRMLKELREDGVATFRGRRVEIHDWERLVKLAEFDPFYLSLQQRPR